jgi:nucleotide-binding universal stress UspA family protein
MKTILVPIGGGESDAAVMQAALAIAEPLAGHLRFLHVAVSPGDAARHTPHVDFARGAAIHGALAELEHDARTRSRNASERVHEFCGRHNLPLGVAPGERHGVTACWSEEAGVAMERILFHARHHDLMVLARHRKADGLPPDRLERLLTEAGRPLMLASAQPGTLSLRDVMVCWRESADAARALGAAMPILAKARNVHIVCVSENGEDAAAGLGDLVGQLRWSGIVADYAIVAAARRPVAETLLAAARDRNAGLMVMGGYGHSRMRELFFGGCTRTILEAADVAVLMAH